MRAMVVAIALVAAAVSAWAELPVDAVRRKEAGNQHLKQREYGAARDQYLAALTLAPEYSDVHYNLGVLYFFRSKDYPRALYHFVRYARLRPDASDLGQVQSLTIQALEKIEDAEREAYAETLRSGTVAALEAFRRAHPQSSYAADAVGKLRLLAEYDKELRRREQTTREAYARAAAQATPGAMDEFLRTYPGAPQSTEATRLRDLWAAQRATDEKAFLAALDGGTAAALATFLEERPHSVYAPEAQHLQQLRGAEEAYRSATEARSVPALERFLASYGDSRHAAEARTLVETLRAEQATATALAAADQAWQDSAAADSMAAYQRFLTGHPDHPRAREARDRIATLEQQAEAERLRDEANRIWQAVEGENRATAYRDFAVAYPDHPNTAEAGRRAAALEEAAATAAVEAQAAAKQAWEDAARADTVAAYTDPPKDESASRETADREQPAAEEHANEALMTAGASLAAAAHAWSAAEALDTATGYEEFSRTWPDHAQADEARRRAAAMTAAAAKKTPVAAPPAPEQPTADAASAAWDKARDTDTVAAYEGFLSRHPDAEEAAAAHARLTELQEPAHQTSEDGQLPRTKRRALNRYRRILVTE